jgi:hypothetical protein
MAALRTVYKAEERGPKLAACDLAEIFFSQFD